MTSARRGRVAPTSTVFGRGSPFRGRGRRRPPWIYVSLPEAPRQSHTTRISAAVGEGPCRAVPLPPRASDREQDSKISVKQLSIAWEHLFIPRDLV